jgi:hypothetical protein
MSFKKWLFWKPMSTEELKESARQHQKIITQVENASVKSQAAHVLNMQKLSFDGAKNLIDQQLWFIIEHLKELTRASWSRKIDDIVPNFLLEIRYNIIESFFTSISNDSILSNTEQKFKSEKLIQDVEKYRETALEKFFNQSKEEYPEFCTDFLWKDSELWEKTYWERLSVMKDRRKEEKISKDLKQKTDKAEKEKIEADEKISEWRWKIDKEFKRKKQAIDGGDESYGVYKINAPYLGLSTQKEIEKYANEKSKELEKHFKLVFILKYKNQIDGKFKAKREELKTKKWWSHYIIFSLPYIGGLDDLIRDEVQTYQKQKEEELEKEFCE